MSASKNSPLHASKNITSTLPEGRGTAQTVLPRATGSRPAWPRVPAVLQHGRSPAKLPRPVWPQIWPRRQQLPSAAHGCSPCQPKAPSYLPPSCLTAAAGPNSRRPYEHYRHPPLPHTARVRVRKVPPSPAPCGLCPDALVGGDEGGGVSAREARVRLVFTRGGHLAAKHSVFSSSHSVCHMNRFGLLGINKCSIIIVHACVSLVVFVDVLSTPFGFRDK
jgi:hypothetical protein